MPNSQSREPGFESPFATILKWHLTIDSGGNVSACNCCVARMLPREAELMPE